MRACWAALRWEAMCCCCTRALHTKHSRHTSTITVNHCQTMAFFVASLSVCLWFFLACPMFFFCYFFIGQQEIAFIYDWLRMKHTPQFGNPQKNSIIIIQKSNDIFDWETIWLIECIKMNVELLPNLLVIKWDRSIEKFINHFDDLTSRQTNEESKERIR